MLTVEREFTIAIYLVYTIDCIHWLKPGEMAVTRCFWGGWRSHVFGDDSYTLLGRMPVFVNPFDFRPSYLATGVEERWTVGGRFQDIADEYTQKASTLTVFSTLGAINLLGFLPLILLLGYLPTWWRSTLAIAAGTQLVLTCELYRQGGAWRRQQPGDFWTQFVSISLNPLAALRSGDVLLRGMFRAQKHSSPPV